MAKNIYRRGGICWARFKVAGIEYRESLRTRSEAVAERRLKARREAIQNQIIYGEAPPTSWKEAFVGWLPWIQRSGARPATIKRYGVSIGQLRPWLDPLDIQQIDDALLKRIVRDRARAGVSNATIRRDLTALSSVLDYAIAEGWISANPAYAFDRRRLKERRDPIALPDAASMARIFAMATRFTDMAELALETGARQEEIAGLTHAQIDRQRMSMTLTRTKGRRARAVPLTAKALAIIDRQPQFLRKPWVFWRGEGERFKNVASQWSATNRRTSKAVQKAAQAIGHNGGPKMEVEPFTPFRFHDLRHLFAVIYLREQRGSIYELQQIMGHASIKTTEEYLAFLTPAEKMAAMHGVAQKEAQNQRF